MADLYTSYETSLALQSTGAPQDVLGAFLDSLARRAEGDEMTAPTPGPWKAKASSSSMNAWVLAGEHVIAVTSKEDAALIAAAPDLLAALVALVKVIDRADDRECPAAALTSGGEVIEAGKPHFCVCGHDHAESFRARIAELERDADEWYALYQAEEDRREKAEAERDRYLAAIVEWVAAHNEALMEAASVGEELSYTDFAEGLQRFLVSEGPEGLVQLFLENFVFDALWGKIEQHAVDRSPDAASLESLMAAIKGVCVGQVADRMTAARDAGTFNGIDWFGRGGRDFGRSIVTELERQLSSLTEP